MQTIQVRHIEGIEPSLFQVVRLSDGKSTKPSPVLSPVHFPVEGRPKSGLLKELRWYLEDFLEYPFPPETDHAERVLESLKKWGEAAFLSLFGAMSARDWYRAATSEGLSELDIQISSDDPIILAWPWEALRDPEIGLLGLGCQIERRLNQVAEPLPLSEELPKERVNILLVTARPYDQDIGYRSISRPLVELIERLRMPARVSVLRPPTFDGLREHLRTRPNYYHILHFDGHGGYGKSSQLSGGGPYVLQASLGRLIFETDDGKPDPVGAEKLSQLLREYRVPAVVLNACQSGMIDENAQDAFASVAASMIKAGIHSVSAMGYSVYVSGAQEFLPAFYRRLFEEGDVARSIRAGRQQMYAKKGRICVRGSFELEDWVVPVVYQQTPVDFSFMPQAPGAEDSIAELPEEASDEENPYGFIGRDAAILQLERAMRRAPAGVVIHGLGGVGKTTLARGFVKWLSRTDGLKGQCFWFTFKGIRSAEYVFNRMGEVLFGPAFLPKPIQQKIEYLARQMKENRSLVVWDNFETVRGIEGAGIEPLLSIEDQQVLLMFLKKLRGGLTKVLITSRGEENWLGTSNRFKLSLGGLKHEERWEFCEVIVRDLGLTVDRKDPKLLKLLESLGGHPLMMRAILPKLEEQSAEAIANALTNNLEELGLGGEETEDKLIAILSFVEKSLPEGLRELLVPLSYHDAFVVRSQFYEIAKDVDAEYTDTKLDDFFQILTSAGLLRPRAEGVYEIHPGLHGFLQTRIRPLSQGNERNAWARCFVVVLGRVAAEALLRVSESASEAPHLFHTYGATFMSASREARRLGMDDHFADIIQSVAHLALSMRLFQSATEFYQQYLECCIRHENARGQAAAYHQLGMVARYKRDYPAADQWSRKSLEIKHQLGDEHGAAITQYQLGQIAIESGNLVAAEELFNIAAREFKRLGDQKHETSATHYQGVVALRTGGLEQAEAFLSQALNFRRGLDDSCGAAQELLYLGEIAAERNDLVTAQQKFHESLALSVACADQDGTSRNLEGLARIAERTGELGEAKGFYLRALAIEEKLGREDEMSALYHNLGIITEKEDDIVNAKQWFVKALEIDKKRGNRLGFWTTYGQMAKLAFRLGDHIQAAELLIASMQALEKTGNVQDRGTTRRNLLSIYNSATEGEKETIMKRWEQAGLGQFPEEI